MQWEPIAALDGGPGGIDLIGRLLKQAAVGDRIKPHGVILLELDPEQIPEARLLATNAFPDAEITVELDLARLDRLLVVSLSAPDAEY